MSFFRPKTPSAYLLIGIAIGAFGGVQATPNKGSHRERAINLVNQAINETEAGMAYSGD